MLSTISARVDRFLGEACEVDYICAVRVDVEKLDAGTEVVHELPQRTSRYSPAVIGLVVDELCMDRCLCLEW